jgi:hypothetical protein
MGLRNLGISFGKALAFDFWPSDWGKLCPRE